MADFNEEAGAFLRVETDDTWYPIKPHEESVVRKAVIDYRERGLDTLVEIEHRMGYAVNLVASSIVAFHPSTPEIRAATVLEEIRQEEWDRDFRKAHATPGWEE